jgi:hypothetical protein
MRAVRETATVFPVRWRSTAAELPEVIADNTLPMPQIPRHTKIYLRTVNRDSPTEQYDGRACITDGDGAASKPNKAASGFMSGIVPAACGCGCSLPVDPAAGVWIPRRDTRWQDRGLRNAAGKMGQPYCVQCARAVGHVAEMIAALQRRGASGVGAVRVQIDEAISSIVAGWPALRCGARTCGFADPLRWMRLSASILPLSQCDCCAARCLNSTISNPQ